MGDSLITIRAADSVHWYDRDGKPRHDATLREARKEGLFPSVTSILAIKAKPQLEMWKTRQLVEQALTVARLPDESDDAWWSRVLAADAEERAKAPDLGTDVHVQLADYIHGQEPNPRVPGVDLGPVIAWIDEHLTDGWAEKRFADTTYGFAGCVDYGGKMDGRPVIVDWKTQAVKKYPTYYPEWCWQLAAYRMGLDLVDFPRLVSVVIDTAAPGCDWKEWTEDEADWALTGFKGLLAAWKADKKYSPM